MTCPPTCVPTVVTQQEADGLDLGQFLVEFGWFPCVNVGSHARFPSCSGHVRQTGNSKLAVCVKTAGSGSSIQTTELRMKSRIMMNRWMDRSQVQSGHLGLDLWLKSCTFKISLKGTCYEKQAILDPFFVVACMPSEHTKNVESILDGLIFPN